MGSILQYLLGCGWACLLHRKSSCRVHLRVSGLQRHPGSLHFHFISRQPCSTDRGDMCRDPHPPSPLGRGSPHTKPDPRCGKWERTNFRQAKQTGRGRENQETGLHSLILYYKRVNGGRKARLAPGRAEGSRSRNDFLVSPGAPSPTGVPARTRLPPPAGLRGGPRPGRASGNRESSGRRTQKVAARREGAAAQARARPGAPRRAHRLHGGGHVVVALRLLRQSRPLQQLLSVPHVARDSASPRAPAPPARCSLARSLALLPAPPRSSRRARALARRLAGGCRLRRRSRPLAGWLHALWRNAAEQPREDGEATAGGRAVGRTRLRLRTRSGRPGAAGGGGRGGPALTVFFKVTSPAINSRSQGRAGGLRRRPRGAAVYRRSVGGWGAAGARRWWFRGPPLAQPRPGKRHGAHVRAAADKPVWRSRGAAPPHPGAALRLVATPSPWVSCGGG